MSMMDIAQQLVDGVRKNGGTDLLDTIYADDAVSVEPHGPDDQRIATGKQALRGKHEWWAANFETHSISVDGPYPQSDGRFAVIYETDATPKDGERFQMKEVALYTVKDDKIVREEFFYTEPG